MDHGEQSTTADHQNHRRSPAIHADSTRPQLAFTLLDDDPQSSFATDLVSASAAAIDKHPFHEALWTGHWDPRYSQPNAMNLPSVPPNSSFANGSEQFIGWTNTSPQSHDDFTAQDGLLLTSVTTGQSHTTSPSPSLSGSVISSKITKPKGRNSVSLYCPFPSDKKDLQNSNRRRLRELTQKANLSVEEVDEFKRLKHRVISSDSKRRRAALLNKLQLQAAERDQASSDDLTSVLSLRSDNERLQAQCRELQGRLQLSEARNLQLQEQLSMSELLYGDFTNSSSATNTYSGIHHQYLGTYGESSPTSHELLATNEPAPSSSDEVEDGANRLRYKNATGARSGS